MKSEFITQEVAAMLRLHQLKLSLDQAAGLDSTVEKVKSRKKLLQRFHFEMEAS